MHHEQTSLTLNCVRKFGAPMNAKRTKLSARVNGKSSGCYETRSCNIVARAVESIKNYLGTICGRIGDALVHLLSESWSSFLL